MPFTNPNFPGQTFRTVAEYEEARRRREEIERTLASRSDLEQVTSITATILPAEQSLMEAKIAKLEKEIEKLQAAFESLDPEETKEQLNAEGITVGKVLIGESKGRKFTLEVLDQGYLCSDGKIYHSLSGAALGVSGNRRSGWRFWKVQEGQSVGEKSGRFRTHAHAG